MDIGDPDRPGDGRVISESGSMVSDRIRPAEKKGRRADRIPDLNRQLAVTGAVVFLGLAVFQAAKHLFAPDIGVWASHAVTNIFATVTAVLAAYFFLSRHHRLHRRASEEAARREATEEALRRSEEAFRTIADFTCDWESWIGPDGRYKYVSPSCINVTGYDPKEFLADPDALEKMVFPEDRAMVGEWRKKFGPEHGVLRFDYRIVHRNGEVRWVSHGSQPVFDNGGRWLGRRVSDRDVTVRYKIMAEKERLIAELNRALTRVKTLSGLVPICANCKKIRNDQGYWEQLEEYIGAHSNAEFSHGICPDCKKLLYSDIFPEEK